MLLSIGSRGQAVSELQRALNAAGYSPGPIDGDFGPQTRSAVLSFQMARHIEVDGVVGPQTNGILFHDGFDTVQVNNNRPSNFVQNLLTEARSHIGYHEGTGNRNPFSAHFGRPAEAWCADFVSYVADKAGGQLNTASAQGVADYLRSRGLWKGRNNPQAGDAVTFRWDGSGGWADHVGIVERVYQSNGHTYIDTIEGNSSDAVRRKTYRADSAVINGYGRIA